MLKGVFSVAFAGAFASAAELETFPIYKPAPHGNSFNLQATPKGDKGDAAPIRVLSEVETSEVAFQKSLIPKKIKAVEPKAEAKDLADDFTSCLKDLKTILCDLTPAWKQRFATSPNAAAMAYALVNSFEYTAKNSFRWFIRVQGSLHDVRDQENAIRAEKKGDAYEISKVPSCTTAEVIYGLTSKLGTVAAACKVVK